MSMISTWNTTVSDAIDKTDATYQAWIGQDPFTPEVTIVDSEDINCGAICNELEFARVVTDYLVESISIDLAEEDELEALIMAFVDLPRRDTNESDVVYRLRYKFIVIQKNYTRWTTKWAVHQALTYYVDADKVQIIEYFDTTPSFFEVRFVGLDIEDDALFLDDIEQGFLDQYFIGGFGTGSLATYIETLIQRIKAAGVEFATVFVEQNSVTKTSDAVIGSVQQYKTVDSVVKASVSTTLLCDATVV